MSSSIDVLSGPGACVVCQGMSSSCSVCGDLGLAQYGLIDDDQCVPLGLYAKSEMALSKEVVIDSNTQVVAGSWVLGDVYVKSFKGVLDGVTWGIIHPSAVDPLRSFFEKHPEQTLMLQQMEEIARIRRADMEDAFRRLDESDAD